MPSPPAMDFENYSPWAWWFHVHKCSLATYVRQDLWPAWDTLSMGVIVSFQRLDTPRLCLYSPLPDAWNLVLCELANIDSCWYALSHVCLFPVRPGWHRIPAAPRHIADPMAKNIPHTETTQASILWTPVKYFMYRWRDHLLVRRSWFSARQDLRHRDESTICRLMPGTRTC